jgi:hypothetical protein
MKVKNCHILKHSQILTRGFVCKELCTFCDSFTFQSNWLLKEVEWIKSRHIILLCIWFLEKNFNRWLFCSFVLGLDRGLSVARCGCVVCYRSTGLGLRIGTYMSWHAPDLSGLWAQLMGCIREYVQQEPQGAHYQRAWLMEAPLEEAREPNSSGYWVLWEHESDRLATIYDPRGADWSD